MRFRIAVAMMACLAAFAGPAFGQYGQYEQRSMRYMHRSMNWKEHNLFNAMRKLWEDHVTWTRLFIVSAAHDSPDKAATTARLLQNQTDIGNAIRPYYGNAAGNKMTELLRDHILIAADIVAAAKNHENGRVDNLKNRWFDNAEKIARFLSEANPKEWPYADMNRMMRDHLNLTLAEATDELSGNYSGSVATYDRVHDQILHMADMLSDGIISQFPNQMR
jgi:hypothetical protein